MINRILVADRSFYLYVIERGVKISAEGRSITILLYCLLGLVRVLILKISGMIKKIIGTNIPRNPNRPCNNSFYIVKSVNLGLLAEMPKLFWWGWQFRQFDISAFRNFDPMWGIRLSALICAGNLT